MPNALKNHIVAAVESFLGKFVHRGMADEPIQIVGSWWKPYRPRIRRKQTTDAFGIAGSRVLIFEFVECDPPVATSPSGLIALTVKTFLENPMNFQTLIALATSNEPAVVSEVLKVIGLGLRAKFPNAKPTMEADLVAAGTALATSAVSLKTVITDFTAKA